MEEEFVALLGAAVALIVFDLAALRFGTDSRSGGREMPSGGDSPPAVRGQSKRRVPRWKRRPADPLVVKQLLVLSPSAGPSGSPEPVIRVIDVASPAPKPRRRWRETPTPVSAWCYQQFDLAARGK